MRFVTPVIVISSAAMTGAITEVVSTASIRLGGRPPLTQCSGYTYHAVWTGTPVGTLKLQASGDGGTTWADVPGSSQAAGGAAGNWLWDVNNPNYEQVRFAYVFGSSTGTLTVSFGARERA